MVEKLFPALVAFAAEMYMQHGISFGFHRFFDKCQAGLSGGVSAFFNVAAGACAHDVCPGGFSAARPWYYMVK